MSDPGTVHQGEHTWEPIQTFGGRYRCTTCGCMGYRGIVTADANDDGDTIPGEHQVAWQSRTPKRAAHIFPYACKHRGCKAHATGWGKRQFCAGHQKA